MGKLRRGSGQYHDLVYCVCRWQLWLQTKPSYEASTVARAKSQGKPSKGLRPLWSSIWATVLKPYPDPPPFSPSLSCIARHPHLLTVPPTAHFCPLACSGEAAGAKASRMFTYLSFSCLQLLARGGSNSVRGHWAPTGTSSPTSLYEASEGGLGPVFFHSAKIIS